MSIFTIGNDTLSIYRIFANLHTNLAPFFLNAGTISYLKNVSVLKPIASSIFINQPSTYDYLIYDQLFVSPITDNSTNIKLHIPGLKTQTWIYWFNNTIKFNGGEVVSSFECQYNEFPLFILAGSILPLKVNNGHTSLGTSASKDYITVMIARPEKESECS